MFITTGLISINNVIGQAIASQGKCGTVFMLISCGQLYLL